MKDAERFRDTEASKSSFMGLTDTKVNLLHIAIHGAYKDIKRQTDAESMQNSLLAFAGANLDENGLVTAADIATMNLRQCLPVKRDWENLEVMAYSGFSAVSRMPAYIRF